MEKKRNGRRDVVMTGVKGLVPQDHLVRKIEGTWIMIGCKIGGDRVEWDLDAEA